MKPFWSYFDDFEYQIEYFLVHLALKRPIWVEVSHTNVPEPSVGGGRFWGLKSIQINSFGQIFSKTKFVLKKSGSEEICLDKIKFLVQPSTSDSSRLTVSAWDEKVPYPCPPHTDTHIIF